MSQPILVTGGTGALGRVVARRLLEAGQHVRVLSRRPAPVESRPQRQWATADLLTGEGMTNALTGTKVIIHCARAGIGSRETTATRTLVKAAQRAGGPHILYVSIVGVDRVPLGYYKWKVAAERLIERCGVPYTILRVTQFHDLLRALFAWAARLPVMPVPDLFFQPIDTGEVADRLVELALGEPIRHAPDMAGPRVCHAADLARVYLGVTCRRRRTAAIRLAGRAFRAYQGGGHLAPDRAVGRITFEQYLSTHPAPASLSYRGERR